MVATIRTHARGPGHNTGHTTHSSDSDSQRAALYCATLKIKFYRALQRVPVPALQMRSAVAIARAPEEEGVERGFAGEEQ